MTPKTDTAAVGERRADDAAELRRRLRLLELENERLQSSLDNSLVILETVKQLTGGAKRSHAVQVVLERTVALFDLADAGLIALYDEEDERLKVVACHHYDPCVLKIRMHPGEGAPGWTYTSQTPHIWAGPEECAECVDPVNPVDRALIRQAVEGRPFAQSLMCSPFLARGKVIGAIQLEHYADERHFSERELQILTNLAADPLAVALDNTALVDQLRRRNRQMRELLRRTINAQEEERERVARNLHDDVSQTLTGLLIALKNLQSVAAAAPNGAELTSYLCDVEEDVRRTIATTQDLAVDLRPALLDDIGLVSALEWYLEHR
ncbi:MAG TPA: GAF domain-containing protein, partial [Thermoleophilia bacterium]|nr:GAF domain-containing protein [Thermoleophilia bacterium]